MKIYLDTKDLIEIIEKSNPISSNDLKSFIIGKNGNLVISNTILLEISEPIINKSEKSNVMSVIKQIEKLPHIFINTKNLVRLELLEALEAFKDKREYKNVDPFTSRFTETLDLEKYFPMEKFIISSLAEIIWILYNEQSLGGFDKHSKKWREAILHERNLTKKPKKIDHFIYTIKKHFLLYNIKPPSEGFIKFGKWIYSNASRCPSTRLINEIFNKIVNNIGDIPEDSDLEDFSHLQCLPYVDIMTVDRRMYGYISQASKSLSRDYDTKILRSAKELLD